MKIEKYHITEVEELPEHKDLLPGYFFYSKEYKCVKFLCPCGCGIEVYLPVMDFGPEKEQDRVWRFRIDPNGPTLSPSIQQTGHCQSHYHIDNGLVKWA